MNVQPIEASADTAPVHSSDEDDLVQRAKARDPIAIRAILKRYNQRLFRIARAIVRDDSTAEDVVQEAYCHAFQHLDRFRGDSSLATWLHRIVMNEALGRMRKVTRHPEILIQPDSFTADIVTFPQMHVTENPEQVLAQRQIMRLVEQAVDRLPESFRIVFIARMVEGMSVDEVADFIGIKPETVRTRLHRARNLLRSQLDPQVGRCFLEVFPFNGVHCERLTRNTMRQAGLNT